MWGQLNINYFWLILATLALTYTSANASTVVTANNLTFCAASFPTSYQSGTIKIAASSATAFDKGQTNKKMDISLPAGFQFNTTAGANTVSYAAGQSLTAASVTGITTSKLTLTLTTSSLSGKFDTLYINVQIRATSAGTGDILRNGPGKGFKIDGSSNNPSPSLGSLDAEEIMAVSSITAVQASTTNVFDNTLHNQILDIRVTATGSCSPKVLTLFNLDTDGKNSAGTNNPTSNITKATIYYTGTSGTFSTATIFGFKDSPDGVFTISGNQALNVGPGTYHFWLVYDIPVSPTFGNRVDASCYSAVVSGVTTALVAQSPTGSRQIAQQGHYYSVTSGNWNDNSKWSNIDGGTSCSCQPNGSGTVHIKNGHTITVNAIRVIDELDVQSGGTLTGGSTLTVNDNATVSGTGKITPTTNWTFNGNLSIAGSGSSTINGILTVAQTFKVDTGATFTLTGGAGKDLIVNGKLTVNGTLAIGARKINFGNALSQELSGTGTITGTSSILLNSGTLDILAGTNLTIAPIVTIGNGLTITNRGTVTINNNLTGGNGTSTWVNAASSSLTISGTLLSTGTLTATASNNTIEYSSSSAQSIKPTTHYNMVLSSSGTKSISADIILNGSLTIKNTAVFDVSASNRAVSIKGNWTVTSTAADPFVSRSGTVSFTGSSTNAQYISSVQSGGEQFYTLEINNTGAGVYLSSDATISQQLNLTAGNFNLNTKVLTISRSSTSAITATAGAIVSEAGDVTAKLKLNIGTTVGTYSFPFVSLSGAPVPVTVQLVSGDLGYLSIATYSTNYSNNYPPEVTNSNYYNMVNRFWQIDKTGGAVNCTVTFTFDETEDPIFGAQDILMQRWNSINAAWDDPLPGQVYDAENRTITVPGITQFSPWGGSGNGSALPIELLEFKGHNEGNDIVLEWSTAVEINNEKFIIERSEDGIYFYEIGEEEGAGNSSIYTTYLFVDKNPNAGINYYRLTQVDIDGKSTESNVIALSLTKPKITKKLIVYPNPIMEDQFWLKLEGDNGESKATIKILNNQGVIIHRQTINIIEGNIMLDIPLPAGLYLLLLQHDNKDYTAKIERR